MKRIHPYKSTISYYTLLLLCSSLLLSCKHDNLLLPKPNENIRPAADFLKNNYDFTLFYAALEYTGLADTLNEKGPFTILAPDNQAFNELGIQFPKDFTGLDKDSLRNALRYHILPRRLIRSDIPVNGVDVRYMTLAGIELYASFATYSPGNSAYPANKLYFSGSPAYRVDVPLANGVLHVLNKVMKQYPGKSVQDWLSGHAGYSMYVAGLKKFGLWDQLAGTGPFTIFAPSNKVFEEAGIYQSDIDTLDPGKYIGDRLFGIYIIYNKRYFLSDKLVFNIINSEGWYEVKARNDESIFSWSGDEGGMYPSLKPYYSMTWLAPKDPLTGQQDYSQVFGSPQDCAKMDNLCENGVIHLMTGILVRPDQAIKK
jgi:uncharacterized surface protein with fasciclin (FAS1) repeats